MIIILSLFILSFLLNHKSDKIEDNGIFISSDKQQRIYNFIGPLDDVKISGWDMKIGKCPRVIPKDTLIIFCQNDIKWSDIVYLTEQSGSNIYHPEPFSMLLSPYQLIVVGLRPFDVLLGRRN